MPAAAAVVDAGPTAPASEWARKARAWYQVGILAFLLCNTVLFGLFVVLAWPLARGAAPDPRFTITLSVVLVALATVFVVYLRGVVLTYTPARTGQRRAHTHVWTMSSSVEGGGRSWGSIGEDSGVDFAEDDSGGGGGGLDDSRRAKYLSSPGVAPPAVNEGQEEAEGPGSSLGFGIGLGSGTGPRKGRRVGGRSCCARLWW